MKEMAAHSTILVWRIPWKEEPGRLQSTGSQRVRHDWATSLSLSTQTKKELRENSRMAFVAYSLCFTVRNYFCGLQSYLKFRLNRNNTFSWASSFSHVCVIHMQSIFKKKKVKAYILFLEIKFVSIQMSKGKLICFPAKYLFTGTFPPVVRLQASQVRSLVREIDPTCYNSEFSCYNWKEHACHNKDQRSCLLQVRPKYIHFYICLVTNHLFCWFGA